MLTNSERKRLEEIMQRIETARLHGETADLNEADNKFLTEAAIKRNALTIRNKALAGERLSATEQKILLEEDPTEKEFFQNLGEVASFIGITRRTLLTWRKKFPGFPEEREDGRVPRAGVIEWMEKNQLDSKVEEDHEDQNSKAYWDKERAKLDFERLSYDFDVTKQKYLSMSEVVIALGQMLSGFRTTLNMLPGSAARWLIGLKDFHAIKDKLQSEVDAVLSSLGRCDYLKGLTERIAAENFSGDEAIALRIDEIFHEFGRNSLGDLLQRELPAAVSLSRAGGAIADVVRSTAKPRPIERLCDWIDRNVEIPVIAGAVNPGPLKTDRFPIYRGLWDLYWRPHVRLFTICKSGRVGGTLFCIAAVLHKIDIWPQAILWVDPTRKTARDFSRGELQAFILACKPVAEQAVMTRETWTTLMMHFKGCILRLAGSGSAAELGGFQAEMVILNERDKLKDKFDRESSSADLAKVRSKQFHQTRKILENSTPTVDTADTWTEFKAGSQNYCYVPCPHCRKRQRLTFFTEEKDVPFDEDGKAISGTRLEKTGRVRFEQFKIFVERETTAGVVEKVEQGYDIAALEQGATYECSHCGKDIEHSDLNWMLAQASTAEDWWSHNPKAPRDHVSVHISALYSPFESWGQLAKKFLGARGSIRKMHDFYNSDLGLPFIRYATTVKEDDIDRAIKRCPRPYVLRELPFEPEVLSMTVDVQAFGFWFSIRAWGVLWDHPDKPIWNALIDYGPAVSWEQIEEISGIKQDRDGHFNRYRFKTADGEVKEYQVTAGLVDSGFEAQQNKNVYEFCFKNGHVFSPSKGGSSMHLRGKIVTTSPVLDGQLELIWYFDDWFKQALYYHNIKEQKALWWLPVNIDKDYKAQLTAEYTKEEHGKLVWAVAGEQGNHLGDTEKLHEVLREEIQNRLLELIDEREAAEEKERAGEA